MPPNIFPNCELLLRLQTQFNATFSYPLQITSKPDLMYFPISQKMSFVLNRSLFQYIQYFHKLSPPAGPTHTDCAIYFLTKLGSWILQCRAKTYQRYDSRQDKAEAIQRPLQDTATADQKVDFRYILSLCRILGASGICITKNQIALHKQQTDLVKSHRDATIVIHSQCKIKIYIALKRYSCVQYI